MAHPLEDVMRGADGFVLVGDSSEERFPATSFHCYTRVGKRFYCLDLGGLERSRGRSAGLPVFGKPANLPPHANLAVVWMKPRSARRGVEAAHEAGCKRVWFSFQTGHPDAVARARELGMEVVEIGRCPVHYLERQIPVCRAHTGLLKLTGSYRRPPQVDAAASRRELW